MLSRTLCANRPSPFGARTFRELDTTTLGCLARTPDFSFNDCLSE